MPTGKVLASLSFSSPNSKRTISRPTQHKDAPLYTGKGAGPTRNAEKGKAETNLSLQSTRATAEWLCSIFSSVFLKRHPASPFLQCPGRLHNSSGFPWPQKLLQKLSRKENRERPILIGRITRHPEVTQWTPCRSIIQVPLLYRRAYDWPVNYLSPFLWGTPFPGRTKLQAWRFCRAH